MRKFKNPAFQALYDRMRANPPIGSTNTVRTAYFYGVSHVKSGHPLIKYPKESQLGAAQLAGVDNARSPTFSLTPKRKTAITKSPLGSQDMMKAVVTLEFGLFGDVRSNTGLTLEAAKVIAGMLHLQVEKLFPGDVALLNRINLNSVTIRHGIIEGEK